MIFSRLEIVKMLRRARMGNAPPWHLRLSLSKWTIRPSKSIVGLPAAIANAICHATGRRIRSLPITVEQLL
jgi:CO/xanthine dehydrogenase Mo-binding subunit